MRFVLDLFSFATERSQPSKLGSAEIQVERVCSTHAQGGPITSSNSTGATAFHQTHTYSTNLHQPNLADVLKVLGRIWGGGTTGERFKANVCNYDHPGVNIVCILVSIYNY